ncbi:MAG: group III truncated hemoglobin [Baekduiaceae bacterium]
MAPTGDIETRADIERLTRAFYEKALADTMIGYLFTDVAQLDLEAHLPDIADFWETILLGGDAYRGGAFAVHADLNAKSPLRGGHFNRWVTLWTQTVDELFAGERADEAKRHAQRVAAAFHRRLQGVPVEQDVAGGVLNIIPPLG